MPAGGDVEETVRELAKMAVSSCLFVGIAFGLVIYGLGALTARFFR